MRVLEAFGEPISYGGQESFVMNVLSNMDRSGITVDLLSPYYCDNVGIVAKISEYGGSVYTLGCDFRPGAMRNSAARPIRSFFRTHDRYDVIHIHSGSNSMLAMFARLAAESGIPQIIVHSHCTGEKGLRHSLSKLVTEGILRKYPTAYCACSREAGEWKFPAAVCRNIREPFSDGVSHNSCEPCLNTEVHSNSDGQDTGHRTDPRKELLIINNGIDVERFRHDEKVRNLMRERLGISDDTVLAGCVGRLTYQKNQEFLLEVLREIRQIGRSESVSCSQSEFNYSNSVHEESDPEPECNNTYSDPADGHGSGQSSYKLILVGDGEDRFALEKKAAELELTEDVIFTGAVDNVEDYLQAMDVVVLPSRYEGLAICAIEAQATGLEVLASDRIPESADVTGNVRFMPADDANMWAAEIMRAHSRHPGQADKVAVNGFSVESTARIVRELYCSPTGRCRDYL